MTTASTDLAALLAEAELWEAITITTRDEATDAVQFIQRLATALRSAQDRERELADALRYALRYLRPQDVDTAYIDAASANARRETDAKEGV